jgi:uncharacterized protein
MQSILITGGKGLVGSRLTELLLQKNYSVSHLSRNNKPIQNVKVYEWNIEKKFIDDEAIESADHIIHLAGANIAGHRWTKKYKQEILNSRVESTNLLFGQLKKNKNHVQSFISASAIGYYGNRGDELLNEDASPGDDFLSDVCVKWESETSKISELEIRTAQIRTGIVFAKTGGALSELKKPMRFGIAAILGNGKQWYSWIHLDDLCRVYIETIENEKYRNAINAVAPNPVRLEELVDAIKKTLFNKAIKIHAPAFLLKLALGEMTGALLSSAFVNPQFLSKNNFSFTFAELNNALEDLLK